MIPFSNKWILGLFFISLASNPCFFVTVFKVKREALLIKTEQQQQQYTTQMNKCFLRALIVHAIHVRAKHLFMAR